VSFVDIQTRSGWGRVLQSFAAWCQPKPGWLALDVGCGPGLLPALLSEYGCRAMGIDLDRKLLSARLYPHLVQAQASLLPFAPESFHLVIASNLLFLLDDPNQALREMARVLRVQGQMAVLNPSEQMSVANAVALADQRGLTGLDRQSLLDWASRAEAHPCWSEADLQELFAAAGMRLQETVLKVGPGLARFARGVLL
jgi:SAM-dependent methyltransferase